MKKDNSVGTNNQINKKLAFKEILDKFLISLKSGDNEFANLADNEYLFFQLKNYGNFFVDI